MMIWMDLDGIGFGEGDGILVEYCIYSCTLYNSVMYVYIIL